MHMSEHLECHISLLSLSSRVILIHIEATSAV